MTTRVVSVRKDTSFREMAAALREHRVSAFPVVDADGKVIGVVSEADMLTKEALGSEPQGMPGWLPRRPSMFWPAFRWTDARAAREGTKR
jgi:CBS domain containing-hemolysin-like protein